MLLGVLGLKRLANCGRYIPKGLFEFSNMTKRRSAENKADSLKLSKSHHSGKMSEKNEAGPAGEEKLKFQKVEYLPTPTKPDNDKKEYRVICLENGLKALLISDTPTVELLSETASVQDDDEDDDDDEEDDDDTGGESEGDALESIEDETAQPEPADEMTDEHKEKKIEEKEAALSLVVAVGSFSDPWEVQGLAHFLEHMVFMGSEKYPKENEFDSYLTKRGGTENANTEFEYTNFYFTCQEKHLAEVMDRFSQFFISPLMKQEAMTRERKSIESEFQSCILYDGNRKQQLVCSLAHPDSPARKFSWGDSRTLQEGVSDEALYKAVHEFRRRHYSSHRMTLAVQARLPLDALEAMVCKHFALVPNNELPREVFNSEISTFSTPEFNKIYYVDPVKDICQLELTWSLPPLFHLYRTKPDDYVASILGHEGSGSLLAYLRKKVWALDIYVDTDTDSTFNSLYSLFEVTLVLTEEGHDNLDKVLEAFFGYLNLVRRLGPTERIFTELKTIADTGFRFAEECPAVDYVTELAENLQFYPPEDCITGPDLYFEYNPEHIVKILDQLRADNVNIVVSSKNPIIDFDKKEEWFGTRYTVTDIPKEWMETWKDKEPDPYYTLPPPNVFLTDNFDLLTHPSPVKTYPEKILQNKVSEVWFRPDDKFQLPLAYIYIYLISPVTTASPLDTVLLELYVKLLNHQVVETLFPASEARLSASIYAGSKGVVLKFSGYNQKLHMLVETVAQHMADFEKNLDERLFDAMKEEQSKDYYNGLLKPNRMVMELRSTLLMSVFWSKLDKYEAIGQATLEGVRTFSQELRRHAYLQCLAQGNLDRDQVLGVVSGLVNSLGCGPIIPSMRPQMRVCQLPLGQTYCAMNSFNEEDVNSVVVNYYQSGLATIRDMCIAEILMLLMEEPVFNVLRTKEQLGYDVNNRLRDTFGILGFSVTVHCQADKQSTEHVDKRIEAFLKSFFVKLKKTTERDFERVKESCITRKQTADLHLKEEVDRNWDEVTSCNYVFDRREKEIGFLSGLKLPDIRKWLSMHVAYGTGTNLRKLSCQVIGHATGQKPKPCGKPGGKHQNITKCTFRNGSSSKTMKPRRAEYSLDLVIPPHGKNYISDIEQFKQGLYIYPVHRVTS